MDDEEDDVADELFAVLSFVVFATLDDDISAAAAVRAATAATEAITPRKLLTELLSKLFDVGFDGFGLVPLIFRSNNDVESGATC